MEVFALFGPQGSGKGTQGKILAEKKNFAYFDTGSQLRKMSEEDTDLGKEIKSCVDKGIFVSDKLIMQTVVEFIKSVRNQVKGIVFDGIPRNQKQREMFEEAILEETGVQPQGILINIPKKEVIKRLSGRWMSRSKNKIYISKEAGLKDGCLEEDLYQRADDKDPKAIEDRIATYYEKTEPVVRWYKSAGRLLEIDGTPPIEEVTKLVDQAIANQSSNWFTRLLRKFHKTTT